MERYGNLHVRRRHDAVGVHQVGIEHEGFLAFLLRKEISNGFHGFFGSTRRRHAGKRAIKY